MLAAASEQLERSLAENPRFHEAQMRQQQASGVTTAMMERSVSLEGYPTYLSSGSGAELASSAAAVVQRRSGRRKSSKDREEQRAMTETHSPGEPSATATASSSSSSPSQQPQQQRAPGETWEHRRKRTHSAPQTPSAAAAVCQILRQRELQREREAQVHAQQSQVSSSSEGQGQLQRSRSSTSTNAAAAVGTAGAKARVMPGLYRGYSTGSSGNSSSYSSGAETLRLDFLTPHAMASDVERSSGASSPELGFKFQQHQQHASRLAPATEAEQASSTALGLALDTSADESEQDGSLSPSNSSAMLPSSSSSPPAAEFYLNPLSFFTLAPVQPLTIDTCQPLLLPPVSLAAPTPSASSDKDSHLGSATPGPAELLAPPLLSAAKSATHPVEAGAPATQIKKGRSGKRAAFSFWADEEEVEEMLARRQLRLDLEEAEAEHASHAPNQHEQEKELVRRSGVGAYLADDEDEPLSSGFVTPTGAHPPLDQHRHQRSNSSLSLFDAPLHPTEPLFRSRSRTTSLDSHAALLDSNGSFHGDPGDEDPETQLAMAILHMHDCRTALSSAAAHSAVDSADGVTPLLSTSSSADGALPLAAAGLPERALVAPSILLGSRNGPSAGTGTMLRRTRFAVAHSAHQRHAAQAAAALAARRNGAGSVRMGGRVRFAETAAMQERRLDKAIKSSAQPWLHRLSRILFFFDDKLDIAEPLGEADVYAEEEAAAPIQSPSSTVKSEVAASPIAPESRPTSKALQRSTSTPSELAVETQQIRRRSVERRRRSFTASAVDLGSKQMDLQQQQQQHRRRSTSRTRKMFGMTSLEAGDGRSASRERALQDPSTASASPSSYYSSSAPTSRRSSWLSLPSLLSRSSSLISLSGAVRNADAEDEDDEDEEEEAEDETPDERAASHPSSDLYISVTGLPSAWYEDMESSSKWAIDASPTWSFTKDAEDADLHDPQRTRSVSSLPSYPDHSRAAFGALTPSSTTTTGKRHLRSLASSPIPSALLPHGQQPSLDDGVLGFEGSHSWSYLTASAARQSNMYLGRGHGSPQLRQYVPLFPATLSPSVREDVIGY